MPCALKAPHFLGNRKPDYPPAAKPATSRMESRMTRSKYFTALALMGLILLTAIISPANNPAQAQTMDTPATHAVILDAGSGTILFEKASAEPFSPASMSKLMTIYLAFELIREGSSRLSDTTIVSEQAWRNWRGRGSTMFLNAGDEVTIADLLRGIIVQSGNDATVVLAEALAGTEANYVEWMNIKAEQIGLKDSHFMNSNGWPEEGHMMSARDLATLAYRTVLDFPELYTMYAETTFSYGVDPSTGEPIEQSNRNPILYSVEGADGLKTGHTQEAGYSLVGSAIRDGRRVVVVIAGLETARSRSREAQRLIEYAYRNFKTYELFKAGQVVETADVWLGQKGTVPLVVADDVAFTMSRSDRNRMTITLSYDSPIPAPILTGTPLATITIQVQGKPDRVIPLLAGRDVEAIGGFAKIGAAFRYLIFGAAD